VATVPNKRFSAGIWKNQTTVFLRSIETEIGRVEMIELMQEARNTRSTTSQTQEDGTTTFESINDVPEEMIIRNGNGEPESSSEDDCVPMQVENGNVPRAYSLSYAESLNGLLAASRKRQSQTSHHHSSKPSTVRQRDHENERQRPAPAPSPPNGPNRHPRPHSSGRAPAPDIGSLSSYNDNHPSTRVHHNMDTRGTPRPRVRRGHSGARPSRGRSGTPPRPLSG
jgi:hypothetical protein